MASLNVYSVGRLAKYVAGSPLRTLRANVYRSAVCRYSTEEKAAEPEADNKQLPGTVEECHKHIESLTAEVNTLRTQVKDFEDKYKRALADGENVRRRMMKQVEDAKSFAIQSFCKDLLDVADTLAAAAESVPESEVSEGGGTEGGAAAALRSLHSGVRLTRAQLTQVFSRHGLVSVSPLREKFDPNLHEALFQQEVEGAEAGTVVAVSKVGYKLHERCVRPALVGVAK
ncbi:grpE protein homolog, mitochondrial [Helicoverpa armigera]|uniref:grpE protein homolog, mitochondrial n=1 Tax=Helicoverpa zea TaxID=7113 RepID=UPI001F595F9A|nr:grpE protein homolog, mitochondrial [Helicoverpa zea]XP_047039045.1 grpE protein homolog, mitochondrial [Helicoverpa zea]XP_049704375.1 grpE protein homolog, mitochondrial isoform X1 [Helicoverpa armigera]